MIGIMTLLQVTPDHATTRTAKSQPPHHQKPPHLAWDVIRGEYGNGKDRIRELTEAGDDYQTVQNRVNQLMS